MKKSILIIITFILCNIKLSAQSPDSLKCDPPVEDTTADKLLPWYDNNDYLEDFLDSIGYDDVSRIVGVDKVTKRQSRCRAWLPAARRSGAAKRHALVEVCFKQIPHLV